MSKLVMAFGSFDILHKGHIIYLKGARRLGERLFVVVARDESIRMMKKRDPVFGEEDRLAMVRELKIVDKAILGNKLSSAEGRLQIIKKYRPDVIAFGYDQKIDTAKVESWLLQNGIKSKVIRIRRSADVKKYKSSIARSKLAASV